LLLLQTSPVCLANFSAGYQVELFRMLAQEVGWEDTDYVLTCIKYSDMIEDLKSPTGSCSMSAAGESSSKVNSSTQAATACE
jgi:hypothetical protein